MSAIPSTDGAPRRPRGRPVKPMNPDMVALLGVLTDSEVGRRAGLERRRVQEIRASLGIAPAPKPPTKRRRGPMRCQRKPTFAPDATPHSVAIATMLRDARIAAPLSQTGLATKMGIAPAYVSLVEAGKRQPSIDVLHAWADACGRDLSLTMTPR